MKKKRKVLAALMLSSLLSLAAPVISANAAWKTTSAGTIYTQTASPGYVTGMKKIGDYWYYFDKKGIMQTGVQEINKKLYYFNEKGVRQKGWIITKDKKYYADKNGVLAVSKWVNNYYFQEDGSMAVNQWIDGKWVGPDGRYTGVKNNVGWIKDGGKTYYYDSNSKKVTGWLNIGGKTYYMDPSTGALRKGWIKVGSKTYYAGPKQGVILKKQWLSGKYLKSDGSVATGFTKIGKNTYYFSSSGKKRTGWIKHNGYYYYFGKNGKLQKNTWIDSKYANSKGQMATGFTKIGKYTYYFNSKGVKQTGWITQKNKRYFLNKNGQLQKKRWLWSKSYYATSDGSVMKGLSAVGGKLYYFNTSTGKKLCSTMKKIGSDTYYFQKDGSAAKNKWVKVKSKYYYFQSSGKLATNTWVGKYYVDSSGARTDREKKTGWSTVNGKKYYFDKSGNMVTGLAMISGKKYYFNSKGVMITGLVQMGGKKYYFYPDGPMATDIKVIVGTKQYTVNESGVIIAEENIKISGSSKGAQIVQYAQQFVGNKYVYGGTSLTNGADCSGFVMSVFNHFGIKLLRVADDQMHGPSESYIKNYGYKRAVVVDMKNIQAGDLLFYGSGNYASHVAIYMGNGKIVHASNSQPYPKGGIKISNYNYQQPIKAVRYWS